MGTFNNSINYYFNHINCTLIMIHIWKLNNDLTLNINIEELLKYDKLATIYKSDTSKEKINSSLYFKYLDFMTNSNGYCYTHCLNFEASHKYSIKAANIPNDFTFPKNNKDIVNYVKEYIEEDIIGKTIRNCIKSLNLISKTITNYIDIFNDWDYDNFRDKDGNIIDISSDIAKLMKIQGNVPDIISKYEEFLEKQKSNKVILRGEKQFKPSMDGDANLEQYMSDEE